jgi:uncharacterized membrane protein YecN with MAPEG domain
VRLALVFGLLSLPVVTWAVANPAQSSGYVPHRVALTDALEIAAVAVLAAALIGGFIGGRLVRHATWSMFVTVTASWFVGMTSLSLVPALLGIQYEGAGMCIDGCWATLTSATPLSGATTWAVGFGFSLSMVAPLLIALACLWLANRNARAGSLGTAAFLVVFAHGAGQFMTFVGGGLPAAAVYLCLGAGLVAWATLVIPKPVVASTPLDLIEPVPNPEPTPA